MNYEIKGPLKKDRETLPISQFIGEIINIVSNNLYCIITGETGSGKSTQISQYVVDYLLRTTIIDTASTVYSAAYTNPSFKIYSDTLNYREINISPSKRDRSSARDPKITKAVVTQPRRVAAIQMARRVSAERDSKLGEEVGYTIRFEDMTRKSTIIKYATDGILVRECLEDRDLTKYDVVILDEAHERSLHTDILFAIVKEAVVRRRGTLRLIVTSATLNIDKFKKYFFNCPSISIKGRCFNVSIYYGPIIKEKRVIEAVKSAVKIHLHEGPGDILVFLTGFEECEEACTLCFKMLTDAKSKGKKVPTMIIIPLYGALSTEQQAIAFTKPDKNSRKVVFSTNIAETSLTVDGVAFVIDGGYVKQKIYNPITGMDSLMIVPISKVQAIQRAGRAGRTSDGKCYRLYSEQFYKEQMPNATVPEIQRVNLSSTILTLKNMGISDVMNFDYLEPPDRESILNALKELYYLKAISKHGNLTALGIEMCKLPLDPKYGKIVVGSILFNCLDEILTIVSILSSEMLWVPIVRSNEDNQNELRSVQKSFAHSKSDHLTLINIFRRWEQEGQNEMWCRKNFLQSRALKQSLNIKSQLLESSDRIDIKESVKYFANLKESTTKEENILKCISTGFFMNSCRKTTNLDQIVYLTVSDGHMATIDENSNLFLFQNFPDWIIYSEITNNQKSKPILRVVSEINILWIKDLLPLLDNIKPLKLLGEEYQISIQGKRKAEEEIKVELVNEQKILEEEKMKKDQEDLNKRVAEAKERYEKRKKVDNSKKIKIADLL